MKKRVIKFTDVDFENLFTTFVNTVMKNGDYGDKELFNAICDIYSIKDYIIEIHSIENKHHINMIEFTYSEGYVIELYDTLKSINNFFMLFLNFKEFEKDHENFIDISVIKSTILPSLEKLINYIEED